MISLAHDPKLWEEVTSVEAVGVDIVWIEWGRKEGCINRVDVGAEA